VATSLAGKQTTINNQLKAVAATAAEMATMTVTTMTKSTKARGRDKLIGIYCTPTPINWNCKRCLYLELQFLRIANPRITIPKNCNPQNCNTWAFIAV
jgi:hypothetical protein